MQCRQQRKDRAADSNSDSLSRRLAALEEEVAGWTMPKVSLTGACISASESAAESILRVSNMA